METGPCTHKYNKFFLPKVWLAYGLIRGRASCNIDHFISATRAAGPPQQRDAVRTEGSGVAGLRIPYDLDVTCAQAFHYLMVWRAKGFTRIQSCPSITCAELLLLLSECRCWRQSKIKVWHIKKDARALHYTRGRAALGMNLRPLVTTGREVRKGGG